MTVMRNEHFTSSQHHLFEMNLERHDLLVLFQPCCACGGQCGAVWRRDLQTTRSLGLGSFTGECNLSNDDLEEVMWRRLGDDLLMQGYVPA